MKRIVVSVAEIEGKKLNNFITEEIECKCDLEEMTLANIMELIIPTVRDVIRHVEFYSEHP